MYLQTLRFVLFLCIGLFLNAYARADVERIAPSLDEQAKIVANQAEKAAGAAVLYSVSETELDERGMWHRRYYTSVRIQDLDSARDYGRISLSYNHYYSNATLEFANVRSAAGEIQVLAEDAVQERVVGGGQDFYSDRSELVFSLPNVAPGSIIEFQYRTDTQRRAIDTLHTDGAGPHWFQRTVAGDGWRADPVHHFRYLTRHPKSISFFSEVYGPFKAKPKLSVKGEQQQAQWQWRDIAGVEIEAAMPETHLVFPMVRRSTSRDWSLVDSWSWQKIKPSLESNGESNKRLQAIIQAMNLADDASELDKVKAVYAYLQDNIRYVFAHVGRGGYDPHPASEVIERGYGDCKDQTVLGLSLLRALGVEAYPALIQTPNDGRSPTNLVNLIFDHMLIWLPATEQRPALWLDTSTDRALFPGASQYLDGQPALIVNGKGGQLVQADTQHVANAAAIKMDIHPQNDGSFYVDAAFSFSGVFEENFRSWWKHDQQRDTTLRQMFGAIFEDKGQYQLDSKVENAEDLDQPFAIHARFSFAAGDETAPLVVGSSFAQLSRFFGIANGLQAPETRQQNFVDRRAIELHMKTFVHAPKDSLPALVASSSNRKSEYFEVQQTSQRLGKDYEITVDYRRQALNLSPEQYAQYHSALLAMGDLGPWLVSIQPDPETQEQSALAEIKSLKGENSPAYQMGLAKQFIDDGEFEQALVPAAKAVELNESNGEAWYILGVAQGFATELEASLQSFEKAEQLGYVP